MQNAGLLAVLVPQVLLKGTILEPDLLARRSASQPLQVLPIASVPHHSQEHAPFQQGRSLMDNSNVGSVDPGPFGSIIFRD